MTDIIIAGSRQSARTSAEMEWGWDRERFRRAIVLTGPDDIVRLRGVDGPIEIHHTFDAWELDRETLFRLRIFKAKSGMPDLGGVA